MLHESAYFLLRNFSHKAIARGVARPIQRVTHREMLVAIESLRDNLQKSLPKVN